jgi:glycosyltransferase involved in cell wall biosynthesis
LDYEFLVIDGGSTDNSLKVIESFQDSFKAKGISFIFQSQKDNGIYDAMNKGVNLAKGNWLFFLNSGDTLISSLKLKDISSLLITNTFDLITGKVQLVNNFGEKLSYTHPKKTCSVKLLTKGYCCIAHQATFISSKLFSNYGLFENYKIMLDYDFWIRLSTKNIKIKFINDVVSNFMNNGISSNRNNVKKAYVEINSILEKYGYQKPVTSYLKILIHNLFFDLKTLIISLFKVLGFNIGYKNNE